MAFFPKEELFADRFEELAKKIQEGGTLFIGILDELHHAESKVKILKDIEREADNIVHGIYLNLHRAFITPLDREDIFSLANMMDNVLDIIESTADKILLYEIREPVPQFKELALILDRSLSLLNEAVPAMKRRRENSNLILDICVEINALENEADRILRQSLAYFFEHEKDVLKLIKCKEILERIEEATDLCEDVSNIFEGIILKDG